VGLRLREVHGRKLAQSRALAAAAHIEQALASAQADVDALVQVAQLLPSAATEVRRAVVC
jgi:hypothetical protein